MYSQCPKSKRLDFRQRRNPNIIVFKLVVFGFWSFGPGLYLLVPNYFEQTKVSKIRRLFGFQTQIFKFTNLCLKSKHLVLFEDFRHNFVSKIRTICSDFRHFCLFEVIWNRTKGDCLKSKHVRISDVYCITKHKVKINTKIT